MRPLKGVERGAHCCTGVDHDSQDRPGVHISAPPDVDQGGRPVTGRDGSPPSTLTRTATEEAKPNEAIAIRAFQLSDERPRPTKVLIYVITLPG